MRFWRKKTQKDLEQLGETFSFMKLILGQKLIGVSVDERYNEWQLHFEDFVVFCEKLFPSPIIQRVLWSHDKDEVLEKKEE